MYFTGLNPVLLVGHIGIEQPLLEEMNMYANKFYVYCPPSFHAFSERLQI